MTIRISKRYNRRSSSLLVIFLLSVSICSGCIFFITLTKNEVQTNTSDPIIVAEYNLVNIPVPAEPVLPGTKFSEIRLKTLALPKHQIPDNAVMNTNVLLDTIATVGLPANLPLFTSNFNKNAFQANPVIEKIPSGMRAMTIKVDATSAVEGWAGSGAIVDVLLVEKDQTTVVAENVKILSAERSVSPVEGSRAPNIPSTVTLLVSQEQCLAINTAVPRGKIAFALRNLQDQENWSDTIFTADNLSKHNTDIRERSTVTGYLEIAANEGSKELFALSDGKWLKTSMKPAGFLIEKD